MQVDIDIAKNNCHFEQCRHYLDGECQNNEARKDCIEIAVSVLCIEDILDDKREDRTDNN